MGWRSPEPREKETLAVKHWGDVQSVSEKNRTPWNMHLQERDPVFWDLSWCTDVWASLALEQWRSPVSVLPDCSRGSVGFSVSGRIIAAAKTTDRASPPAGERRTINNKLGVPRGTRVSWEDTGGGQGQSLFLFADFQAWFLLICVSWPTEWG